MTVYDKEVSTSEQGQKQRVAIFKATQLIWLLLYILEGLIGLRVVFKLISVNADNTFAFLLYGLTSIFVAPFASLVGAPSAGGVVLEIFSIIAMIVYALIGWVLARIVYVAFYRPRGPVSVKETIVTDQTHNPPPIIH